MISKETLEGVKKGILTDEQLNEALKHYSTLYEHLKCHGERYHLVTCDVCQEFDRLLQYKELRKKDSKITYYGLRFN